MKWVNSCLYAVEVARAELHATADSRERAEKDMVGLSKLSLPDGSESSESLV